MEIHIVYKRMFNENKDLIIAIYKTKEEALKLFDRFEYNEIYIISYNSEETEKIKNFILKENK